MLKAAWQGDVGKLQHLVCCWMLPLRWIYFIEKNYLELQTEPVCWSHYF